MKMLEDLEEVVRIDRDKRAMYAEGEMQTSDALRRHFQVESAEFIRTHHATIRDLAARLEALQLRETQLVDAVSLLQKRLGECEQECREEARLNGMGSEREAALMARLKVAERDSKRLDWVENYAHALDWDEHGPMRRVIRADDGYEFCGDTWREQIDAAMQEAGR